MPSINIEALEREILEAAEHVPFGNSAFQTTHFTGGDESGRSTARRVRALLLNIDSKIQALRENHFFQQEHQIDLDEADHKLTDPDLDSFERRRLLLKKERAALGVARAAKLLRDAIAEIEVMYQEWKSLPPVESRQQFEEEEHRYWIDRLVGNAVMQIKSGGRIEVGTIEALHQIGVHDVLVAKEGDVHLVGPAAEMLALEDKKEAA
ncbi:hypothetical protein J2848_005627 [Azospirillum lipoferum]|uniref:Uncharacterized protein n=1 Tax=Azospirillum lipoferum TaxID=193 RepID=A0A5A9GH05_AZOLI|nr:MULTISPECIES: hypothetical protein [Azospirillum]KAA0593012.1 hypothetical protein FZ942_26175 [Azospirillum lipoferum]MCP1613926.1 hypothetical protein [Azospirillum lipoferum]MDW5537679.1 hypothetical protein [Azospirillum sp. NL1]